MRNRTFLFSLASVLVAFCAQAQNKKIDTTASFGDAGYRVSCTNKKEDENIVNIVPKGFKNTARDITVAIKGKLISIIVDDLNDDGFPELLLCYFSGAKLEMGNIYGVSSSGNNELLPIAFPDLYNDPKLRVGYKGHDEFTIMAGSLMRSFPIYKPEDTTTPTGGTRVIQYKIMPVPNRADVLTFKVLRSYEK